MRFSAFFALMILSLGGIGAYASTQTTLEREEITEALTGETNRSPAVLDLPTDRPSGDNVQPYLDHEKQVRDAQASADSYPATE